MSRRIHSVILGLTVALAVGVSAQAQPRLPGSGGGGGGGGGGGQPAQSGQLVTSVTPEMTAQMLTQVGYKNVEVYSSQAGRKHVKALLGQLPVYVLHANCEGEQCSSLAFATFFGKQANIDWNYINAWHKSWRYTRLYRNDEEDLVFDMDMHFHSGVTPDYLQKSMVLYAQMLNTLLEFKPGEKK